MLPYVAYVEVTKQHHTVYRGLSAGSVLINFAAIQVASWLAANSLSAVHTPPGVSNQR